jgi:thiamine-phosphate pyrophosphorylase
VLRPVGGRLLLAGAARLDGQHLAAVGLDGQHLAAADEWPQAPSGLIGRSCHNAAELTAAAAFGAGYATLSPVFRTASKPGYGPPLGLARLAELCAGTTVPIYALGGVDSAERATACRRAGATGVAVMGAVMRSADPATVVASLIEAVRTAG